MEQGLAQQMAGPQKSMQMQMPTVDEVVALLMQGISPEELLKAGIPEQLLMEAIAMLEQQMAAQQGGSNNNAGMQLPPQQNIPAEAQGLAGSMAMGA